MSIRDVGPDNIEQFRSQLNRGTKLFQEAMDEYSKTTEPHKKAQLQKVMNETMTAMNQILNDVLKESAKSKEVKLQQDYNKFIANANQQNIGNLNNDLKDIQNSI